MSELGQKYFALMPDCRLVKGASRGAFYDLRSGDIYSIDPAAVRLIETCMAGRPVAEAIGHAPAQFRDQARPYLKKMQEAGLGDFRDTPAGGGKTDPLTAASILEFIWLELTEQCNLRCRHCYGTCGSSAETGRLEQPDWQRVISEARQLGCRALQFIGGEPLLWGERLFDLARAAKHQGYRHIELYSNLTLLHGGWIDRLSGLGMKVATTVYSHRPEIHDAITGVPGSWRRTIDAVRRLCEAGVQPRLGMVVMPENRDDVPTTLAFLRGLGDPDPRTDPVRPTGRGHYVGMSSWGASAPHPSRTMTFPKVDRETFARNRCGNGCWQGKAAVSSRGDVLPCIMHRDGSAGSVKALPLAEIVRNGLDRYWQLSLDKVEGCRDCEYRYACPDCRPVALGTNGSLFAKPPHCAYDPYLGACVGGAGYQPQMPDQDQREAGDSLGHQQDRRGIHVRYHEEAIK
jgi:radical SAM protein with 4Fe4S-binding SPASM domain